MKIQKMEQELEQEFHISRWIIVYKFILGVFELILGIGMIFFGDKLFNFYYNFRDQELLEDPHDLVVTFMEKVLPFLLEHKGFIILLLLLLGITKVVGAVGLYYKKHWGLDILIAVTFLLLPFDLIDVAQHPTLGRFSFFILNILIALYLVNFKPHHYFHNLKRRFF